MHIIGIDLAKKGEDKSVTAIKCNHGFFIEGTRCLSCECEIGRLRKIIESYELDIRNSKETIDINLVELGFCQGEIYKTTLKTIK